MPMKCIDQMPNPIATAPPSNHQRATLPCAVASRPAMSNAVYDASTATTIEKPTRVWS